MRERKKRRVGWRGRSGVKRWTKIWRESLETGVKKTKGPAEKKKKKKGWGGGGRWICDEKETKYKETQVQGTGGETETKKRAEQKVRKTQTKENDDRWNRR